MILTAILAVQAAAMAPQPTQAPAADVVVIGNRLKTWHGSFRTRGGKLTCRTTRSSGDAAVDAIGCGAMEYCFGPLAPQFDALAAVKDKAERQTRFNALLQDRVPCLREARSAGIAVLAGKRRPK